MRKNNIILPIFNNVIDTTLCTTISNDQGAKVSTIEHLMGALYGLGIDKYIWSTNSDNTKICGITMGIIDCADVSSFQGELTKIVRLRCADGKDDWKYIFNTTRFYSHVSSII